MKAIILAVALVVSASSYVSAQQPTIVIIQPSPFGGTVLGAPTPVTPAGPGIRPIR